VLFKTQRIKSDKLGHIMRISPFYGVKGHSVSFAQKYFLLCFGLTGLQRFKEVVDA
jgi:hypothetical protein